MPIEPKAKVRAMDMLRAYCNKAGIKYTNVDQETGLVVHIEKNGKHLVVTSKINYPLNSNAANSTVRDKEWASLHLKQHGYNVPKGCLFFVVDEYKNFKTTGRSLEAAIKYAEELGYPVFVKPNRGAMGKLAGLVHTDDELKAHFEAIAKADYAALVQEPIAIPEYRLFVLGDQVEFTYRKSRPEIIGDGASTIEALVDLYNKGRKKKIGETDLFLQEQFTQFDLTWDTVLEQGICIGLSPNSNLNAGGKIVDYDESVRPVLNKWASDLIKVFGLEMAGVDVFGESLDNPEDLIVLEINGVPSLSSIYDGGHQDKVLDLWEKMLNRYFEG
ncbi:MAG: hypothetical protein GY810_19275 [Aureispira sp.]|nr:hypothetical protein [Aureispira sp.]